MPGIKIKKVSKFLHKALCSKRAVIVNIFNCLCLEFIIIRFMFFVIHAFLNYV